MTGRLYPTLPLHADETLTSYVSRLARLHRLPNARQFCHELGFSFRSLCRGDPTAIERLSHLVEEPLANLRKAAFTRSDDRWVIRGEILTWPALRRSSFAYCSACLHDDATSSTNPGAAAYERTAWALSAFQTCPIHAIALSIGSDPRALHHLRDFSRQIECIPIGPVAVATVKRSANGLEHYIARRLSGTGTDGEPSFDQMPLRAVIRVCEVFGTAALFGPARTRRSLSPDDCIAAGGLGFALIRRGRAGIVELLDRVRATQPSETISSNRPSIIYRQLYTWIYYARDPAYADIKANVIEYIVGHSQINVSKKLFGQQVANRPWSSIRNAHVATGIDPSRLRSILAASGLIANHSKGLPDSHVIVSTSDLNALIDKMQDSVGWDGLKILLGVSRSTAKHFLGSGLIEPIVSKGSQSLKSDLFHCSDIQRVMDGLMSKAVPIDVPLPTMAPMISAYRQTKGRTHAIITLALNGDLEFIGKLNSKVGIPSILVDLDEVRKLLNLQTKELTLKKAASELKIHPTSVKKLLSLGCLNRKPVENPYRNRPLLAFTPDSIQRFKKNYVTRFDLRQRTRLGYDKIASFGKQYGLRPAFPYEDVSIHIYRRDAAQNFIAALIRDGHL